MYGQDCGYFGSALVEGMDVDIALGNDKVYRSVVSADDIFIEIYVALS